MPIQLISWGQLDGEVLGEEDDWIGFFFYLHLYSLVLLHVPPTLISTEQFFSLLINGANIDKKQLGHLLLSERLSTHGG